ncbi:MAG TPA: lipase maturation factor family protein [Terriglobales bacterium]|nr:lipase maturation factor family protein [Terriglobales bacterium]
MPRRPASAIRWLFDSERGPTTRFLPRWLFLRALGIIYFSAFFSLIFQIRGEIGPDGILPAGEYLHMVARAYQGARFWYAPSLFWIASGPDMLMAVTWIGLIASILLFLNFWPRGMLVICFVCFLAFVSASSDFSSYQSDGMLLEAGFISLFFAPPGFRPGLSRDHPPVRAAYFLLLWEWFRIYFESGAVKLLSHDPEWRSLTAMDEYYQNGPLPTWIGWYMQHLPHRFHVFTAGATLVLELGLVWILFLPRRWRIVLFFIVTPWEIVVILTANYCFLNYLVLSLGVLLLDDQFLINITSAQWKEKLRGVSPQTAPVLDGLEEPEGEPLHPFRALKLAIASVLLSWIFYAATIQLIWMFWPVHLPMSPVVALEPFRIANRYGLFAVMTRGRYEIEFQGSNDGENWTPYPFRFKPQAVNQPPGLYAPYQPRFDWNLWFASLTDWREAPIVPGTEERLLTGSKDVVALFAGNPFPSAPPKQIRAVLWQYWFTSMQEKRATGNWWTRKYLGLYAPTLQLDPSGKFIVVEWPTPLPPHE